MLQTFIVLIAVGQGQGLCGDTPLDRPSAAVESRCLNEVLRWRGGQELVTKAGRARTTTIFVALNKYETPVLRAVAKTLVEKKRRSWGVYGYESTAQMAIMLMNRSVFEVPDEEEGEERSLPIVSKARSTSLLWPFEVSGGKLRIRDEGIIASGIGSTYPTTYDPLAEFEEFCGNYGRRVQRLQLLKNERRGPGRGDRRGVATGYGALSRLRSVSSRPSA